ncbi:hypothetical protein P7L54_12665 [Acinetobacter bereziniae]|uniref:DUF7709 domain-containing protein n=1 Tax=Acinetobacter bereziniae LMG 1003 = CIP 70.12 TaxID=981324 RepID=N9DGR7_ACIBZ|nr:hypothetical protein [Acinetobacter bereziniae]ENV97397.1 hypothetical protein F938_01725 [Acinetobacter bereziniae LMG 1003 = CIP 70.12]MBJ9906343.1 hypothetical protein [Acinetobacter bereziniae]MBJ9927206.1 hypothetical protein [Acinetobacter bereziniae]MCV2441823.1 hypothetical protein [Acinetobacter bereziniae]MDG3556797.1 hypothetical protein [Acinetobacter bereziniae]
MSSIQNSNQLSSINQKIIQEGEVLPAVTLKDGTKVQTGTVATMLHNIDLYNQGLREEVEQELILAIPTLIKVGLFDLFSPDEWISGDNLGRRFVGEKAKQFLASQ